MTKPICFIFFCLGIFGLSACYTDDTSPPSPDRLPFEDFNEFFESNNNISDTLTFNADAEALVTTPKGTKINIPENTFLAGGEISLEIKEAVSKSDFIFLDKATIDGNDLVESSGAVFLKPFTNAGALALDNPLGIEMTLPVGVTGDGMQYYYYQNGWTADNGIEIIADNDNISFETTRAVWQMGGKIYSPSGTAQLTIHPVGYGTIPHDMRVFLVFSAHNIVLPLDDNVSEVSASGTVPTGTEVTVLALVMDHFKLSVGTKTLIINGNTDIDVDMNEVSVDEMRAIIKSLD